jgi:hypothetical protein
MMDEIKIFIKKKRKYRKLFQEVFCSKQFLKVTQIVIVMPRLGQKKRK